MSAYRHYCTPVVSMCCMSTFHNKLAQQPTYVVVLYGTARLKFKLTLRVNIHRNFPTVTGEVAVMYIG